MILLFSLIAVLGITVFAATDAMAQCRTFSSDADFSEGVLFNLNYDPPNSDQLQLNPISTPFPFINIAASSRGTVVRIDVNTGQILGEYHAAPSGMGLNPSRTTVDLQGNVWVANRAEGGISGGIPKGSITRIGIVLGGTRANADGSPNPGGQYLKPPFLYSTVTDRDGDGLIKTSFGLANILPWTNAGGADTHGGVTTADDECIINYTRVLGTGTRTLAIDANNDVWVGGMFGLGPDHDHEKVDGVTGLPIAGSQFNLGCGGYGGLIDGNGIFWSASQCSGDGLLRYDPSTTTGTCLTGRGEYGLGIDPTTGNIWHSTLCANPRNLYEINPAGVVVNSYPQPFNAQGVAVDGNGHVWMAEIFGSRVWHLAPDPLNPGSHVAVGVVSGFVGTTGLAVDANGKIWASETGDRASRIDPSLGPVGGGGFTVGEIDLSVNLGAGAGPYNYSDMTGFISIGVTAPQGTWTITHDGGATATNWGKVCWNSEQCDQPVGSDITARVRSSEDQLTWSAWVAVDNCVDFDVPDGQYLEIEFKLTPNAAGESAVLCDVEICTGVEPVAIDIKPTSCPNPLSVKEFQLVGPATGTNSVVPVAIVGTDVFDASTVDPSTVMLEGVPALRWTLEDVASPVGGDPEECKCTTEGSDGLIDLSLKFNRDALIAALDLSGVAFGDMFSVKLTGELWDGGMIAGTDCMILRLSKGGNGRRASAEYREPVEPIASFGNSPNPFNAGTMIRYQLNEPGIVDLAIFNALGQRIRTLERSQQQPGTYEVLWDGTNRNGQTVSTGVYFSRLQLGNTSLTRQLLLLK